MAGANAALQLAARGFFAREMNAGWREWTAAGLPTHEAKIGTEGISCTCSRAPAPSPAGTDGRTATRTTVKGAQALDASAPADDGRTGSTALPAPNGVPSEVIEREPAAAVVIPPQPPTNEATALETDSSPAAPTTKAAPARNSMEAVGDAKSSRERADDAARAPEAESAKDTSDSPSSRARARASVAAVEGQVASPTESVGYGPARSAAPTAEEPSPEERLSRLAESTAAATTDADHAEPVGSDQRTSRVPAAKAAALQSPPAAPGPRKSPAARASRPSASAS
jgi:hypothetical protein